MTSSITRGARARGATLAAAACLAVLALTVPSAQAAVAPNGAVWYPTLTTCDTTYHTINRQYQVYPQPGWSSQYVRTRIYQLETKSNTGMWSAWSQAFVVYKPGTSFQVGGYLTVKPWGAYRFYSEIQWWNGSRWSAVVGAWDYHYVVSGFGAAASHICYT